MEDRRKAAGRRIYRARLRAGYRSQRAFAQKIGVHEGSVAHAERGDPRIGDSVFAAIEDGLGWPEDSILNYIKTGEPLPSVEDDAEPESETVSPEVMAAWLKYQKRRVGGMSQEKALPMLLADLERVEEEYRERRAEEKRQGRSA